ncbi:DUF3784 domain-containing protein [Planococcus dechangensis]|uniref:DUF3784 domain-containing protein n=1 Tax=Planococcus dechangensis TaxID=1176255 RepID=A0ABV9MHN0_9BACL
MPNGKKTVKSDGGGEERMEETSAGIFIIGAAVLVLVLLGLYMMQGKGAFLIAGYNTMPKNEKAKYDGPAMARFVGKLLMALACSMLVWFAGMILEKSWMFYIGVAMFLGFSGFALIYMNTGGRFLKEPGHTKQKNK